MKTAAGLTGGCEPFDAERNIWTNRPGAEQIGSGQVRGAKVKDASKQHLPSCTPARYH